VKQIIVYYLRHDLWYRIIDDMDFKIFYAFTFTVCIINTHICPHDDCTHCSITQLNAIILMMNTNTIALRVFRLIDFNRKAISIWRQLQQ